MNLSFRYLTLLTFIAIAYLSLVKISLLITLYPYTVSLIWLPSGFSFAMLFLFGRKVLPALLIGIGVAMYLSNLPIGLAIYLTIGNILEPIFSSYILTQKLKIDRNLSNQKDVFLFLVYSVFLSPIISMIFGLFGFYSYDMIPHNSILFAVGVWWAGNAFGILSLGSLILIWYKTKIYIPSLKSFFEPMIILLCQGIINYFIYTDMQHRPIAWLIFPFLVWSSLKLSQRLNISFAIISIFSVLIGSINGYGPFINNGLPNYILIYSFIFILMFITLIMGAMINEKKENSNQVKELNRELESTISNIQGYVYRLKIDETFTMIYISKRVEEITGYSVNEFLKEKTVTLLDIIHPDDIPFISRIIENSISKKIPYEIEYRIKSKSGEEKWILDKADFIFDNEGNILFIEGFATDITKRKQSEIKLYNTQEQLELALSGADLGIWNWNFETGSLSVNNRWMEMIGLDVNSTRPTIDTWNQHVYPEDIPKLMKIVEEVFLNPEGKFFEVEVRAKHTNGKLVWILDKGAVIERTKDGKPLRISGTHMDITLRKEIELEQKNIEQKFRLLVESSSGVVWEANAETFQFNSISKNVERIFGYPQEAWLEPNFWAEHIYLEDKEFAIDHCLVCTQKNLNHDFEYRFIKANGEIIW
ncbi:MAG: PAS domain-containing protein, partial [Leptospiraceae bacterium]|nr:PAS domain-containing protein [Leptospiraceae bacterium]